MTERIVVWTIQHSHPSDDDDPEMAGVFSSEAAALAWLDDHPVPQGHQVDLRSWVIDEPEAPGEARYLWWDETGERRG